jgi:hypothetical protein
MATVQLRNPTEGRAYYDRKKAAGKTSNEAMRALKRRLSDIVYRHMIDDAITTTGTRGATTARFGSYECVYRAWSSCSSAGSGRRCPGEPPVVPSYTQP